MGQSEGLCSPASATEVSYITTEIKPLSSQLVSFTIVPMVTGQIPIQIRLFDVENEMGIDAVEKKLNVKVSEENYTFTLYININMYSHTHILPSSRIISYQIKDLDKNSKENNTTVFPINLLDRRI